MRGIIWGLALVLFATLSMAQQAMSNDSVIKMVKAGLSDEIIIATVNAQPGQYDTSVSGLVALKQTGVDDRVTAALISRAASLTSGSQASPAGPPPSTAEAGTNPDDPKAPHEAGIYFFNQNAAGPKMTELEPSVYTQGKTGGMFATAMTYGIAKAKTKAVLRGAHANARLTDPKTVFYFYFEQQAAGLSQASSPFGGTSTPNEYTLLKFDLKNDSRETVIGKFNAYGASGGTDEKAVVAFSYEKLRPGVYKVTINNPPARRIRLHLGDRDCCGWSVCCRNLQQQGFRFRGKLKQLYGIHSSTTAQPRLRRLFSPQ